MIQTEDKYSIQEIISENHIARMTATKLIGWSLMLFVGLCSTSIHVSAKSHGRCSSRLLGMFCKESSYVTLAEHLHSATPSSELDANIEAASSLLEQLAANELKDKKGKIQDLATAFSSLNDSDDNERLCGKPNLASLRRVASAMREGGNSKSASEPVRRLNRIVIKLIAKARMVCFIYLDSKWPTQFPEQWQPPFSEPKIMSSQISRLDRVTESFSVKSYLFSEGPSYVYDKKKLGEELSWIIGLSLDEVKTSDQKPVKSQPNAKLLIEQLEKFVLKPCDELELFEQSKSILEPYYDLLVAARVIKPTTGFMKKFYLNASEKPSPYGAVSNNPDVQRFAFRLKTCRILKQQNKKQLAKLVLNYRRGYLSDHIMNALSDFDRGLNDKDDDNDNGMNVSALSVGAWGGR